jgi:hypothetical protein
MVVYDRKHDRVLCLHILIAHHIVNILTLAKKIV